MHLFSLEPHNFYVNLHINRNSMDLSIIIVNYYTINLVIDCITSIKAHTNAERIKYEIIVVDNCSDKRLSDTIKPLFPNDNIVCIVLDKNLGFGKANNKGFEIAKGRYLFCLNPDTLLVNNAIEILFAFMESNPGVGACGANLFDMNMQPALSYRRLLPSFWWEFHVLTFHVFEKIIYAGNSEFNHTDKPMDVAYITGADLMMRKEVVDLTNGFLPDYFMYYEETDLCNRIKALGYRIVNVPQAKIQHLEGKSFACTHSAEDIPKSILFSEEGRMIYYRKNVGRLHTVIANYIYWFALIVNKYCFKLVGNDVWFQYDSRKKAVRKLIKDYMFPAHKRPQ